MGKRGVKNISGSASPRIGQPVTYRVSEFYPGTPVADQNRVKWNLYAIENGRYRLLDGGPTKFGRTVSYEFPQKWYGKSLLIEAYIHSPEVKAPPGIIVSPVSGPKKINTMAIRDANGNPLQQKPKYGQYVTAVVTTENMVGDEFELSIWERDTVFSNSGHDADNELLWRKNVKVTATNGVLRERILLDTGMMVKANRSFNEGSEHEYYLVARYANMQSVSNQTVAVKNEQVLSQPSRPTPPPPRPRPQNTNERSLFETVTTPIVVAAQQGWDILMDRLNKPVTVEATERTPDENCPNCNKDITLAEIKAICVSAKNRQGQETSLITDDTLITAALPHLNRYREKVGIKTCTSKAHFLAQLSVESKFYDVEEGFNYYWEALISTFSAFRTEEGRRNARLWGRAVRDRNAPNYQAVTAANQTNIANWAYKNNNSNGSFASGDGSTYRGRGFKQITWKANYRSLSTYFNDSMKISGDADVDWEANPLLLTTSARDAMISALAFWGKNNLSNVGRRATDGDVRSVTAIINPALKGLDERKRFFKKAVEVLKVEECKHANVQVGDEVGTVLYVAGTGSKIMGDWVVYETSVYQNMSVATFKRLKGQDQLPASNFSTFFARDAHGETYGTHSNQRYGKYNEAPPGEYYLIAAVAGQRYKMYISDDNTSAAMNGPHGQRTGVALHQYNPKFAIGCLTSCTGRDLSVVNDLLDAMPDLPRGDDKNVRIILEERSVKEETWHSANIGTTKWTGIL